MQNRNHVFVPLFSAIFSTFIAIAAGGAADEKADASKPAPLDRRVLIVSIDGLRPDLIFQAETPNLRALMKSGAYSLWAQTLPIGKTLPSHTSMLTGVSMEKHGIYWNEDWVHFRSQIKHPNWPTIFEVAKDRGYSTALVAGKYKFDVLAKEGTLDWRVLPDKPKTVIGPAGVRMGVPQKVDANGLSEYDRKFSDEWAGGEAAKVIAEHQPRVMFVHFGRVDSAGHAKGWGSPQQLTAIALADKGLGQVLEALRDAEVFDDTLIIISADHGGMGQIHNGKDPRGLHIPWIIHGPNVKKNYDLNRNDRLVISTMDTFATAASHLGISFKFHEEIEGRNVKDAFEPVKEPVKDPTTQ